MRRELEIVVAGESLRLHCQRAVFWPGQKALLVADVHLGKAAAFRAGGVPVPTGSTVEALSVLTELVEAYDADRLIVLGDLWHSAAGRTQEELQQFARWRASLAGVEMTLVEGNHDRFSGRLPASLCIEEVREPFALGPFALCHYPETTVPSGYRLAGHLHPGVRLEGRGRQSLRLPCFIFSEDGGILPAFGPFTGMALVDPEAGDRVFVPIENRVLRVA